VIGEVKAEEAGTEVTEGSEVAEVAAVAAGSKASWGARSLGLVDLVAGRGDDLGVWALAPGWGINEGEGVRAPAQGRSQVPAERRASSG
jgi:hypothetical protein